VILRWIKKLLGLDRPKFIPLPLVVDMNSKVNKEEPYYYNNLAALQTNEVLKSVFNQNVREWIMIMTRLDPVFGEEKDKAAYLEAKHKIDGAYEIIQSINKDLKLIQTKQPKGDKKNVY